LKNALEYFEMARKGAAGIPGEFAFAYSLFKSREAVPPTAAPLSPPPTSISDEML
jgi:hypothetical protein